MYFPPKPRISPLPLLLSPHEHLTEKDGGPSFSKEKGPIFQVKWPCVTNKPRITRLCWVLPKQCNSGYTPSITRDLDLDILYKPWLLNTFTMSWDDPPSIIEGYTLTTHKTKDPRSQNLHPNQDGTCVMYLEDGSSQDLDT